MAKVIIKSEKLTPFGGIFSVMEHFDALLSKTIDSSLGFRCKSYGYQYRAIKEFTAENVSYTSDSGKAYEFNTADLLNNLLLNALLATSGLRAGESYTLDFDHQFIETEKYDAKPTYRKKYVNQQTLCYSNISKICL